MTRRDFAATLRRRVAEEVEASLELNDERARRSGPWRNLARRLPRIVWVTADAVVACGGAWLACVVLAACFAGGLTTAYALGAEAMRHADLSPVERATPRAPEIAFALQALVVTCALPLALFVVVGDATWRTSVFLPLDEPSRRRPLWLGLVAFPAAAFIAPAGYVAVTSASASGPAVAFAVALFVAQAIFVPVLMTLWLGLCAWRPPTQAVLGMVASFLLLGAATLADLRGFDWGGRGTLARCVLYASPGGWIPLLAIDGVLGGRVAPWGLLIPIAGAIATAVGWLRRGLTVHEIFRRRGARQPCAIRYSFGRVRDGGVPSESARRGPRMAASGDGTAVRAAFERLATRSEEPPGDSKFSGVVERVAGRGLDERRRDLWRVAELAPVRLGRTMRTYYGALAGLLAAIGGTAWFVRRFEDFGAESGPSSWFGDEQAPFFHAMFALVYFMPQIVAGARGERRRRGGLGAAYLPIGFDEMTRALRSRAVVQAGLALPGAAACAVCLTLAGDAAGWAAIDGALRPLLLHVLLAPLMVDGVLVCRGSGSLATWSDFLAPRNWIRIGIAVLVLTLAGWFFVAPSPGSTTADRRTLGTYLASVAALAFVAQRAVGRLRREHATEDWR